MKYHYSTISNMTSTKIIRQMFIDFFRKNKHKLMRQSKVFNDDPSLLFVNSGMCQLKDVFLGKKEQDKKYTSLMNSQICIRAGGKHNDFDDVGKDSYHLTLFEMLGNWSIDSYGKDCAIDMAYRFLTQDCKLDPNNMYVTYFEGNSEIETDKETKELWGKYFPENKIIASSFKDNFWMMADTGPCGVCTEIHYDLVGNRDASNLVNKGDPTVVEIWNLVFMQYNKTADNNYLPLGKLFVDTGMGLERLSMVMNKKDTIYKTDAFQYLTSYAQILSNSEPFEDKYDSIKDTSYRIFADHIRTSVICLYQGLDFDVQHRGYILRKIFRRLLTHFYLYLNNKTVEPFMHKLLVKCLISDILDYNLEFKHDADSIQKKLVDEEHLYVGKLQNIKLKYKNCQGKLNSDLDIIEQLKQDGIPEDMIKNVHDLVIIPH